MRISSGRYVRFGALFAVVLSALASGSAAAQGRDPATDRRGTRLEGRVIQAGLVVGHAEPGSRVTLDGRRVRVAGDGTFLIGFAMDAPETMVLDIVRPDGSHHGKTFQIEQRQYGTEQIDDLPEDEVELDRSTRGALRRAHRRIVEVRRRFTLRPGFTSEFTWPVRGRLSTPFGVGRILNGEPRSSHDAVDIAVPVGTVVQAPAAGVVAYVAEDVPLSGRVVILDHGMGLTSTFLHLSEIRVSPGDRVERGGTIGLSGDTGRTTGPHLHWGLHLAGVALDAELLFPARPAR
jgi:murein DD-endopeptidase MepM/ murein hydrolase activator NlpD